jgi:hypothetical protein
MFPGSIVPQALKELIRVVKPGKMSLFLKLVKSTILCIWNFPGGIITWNIGEGYEKFNKDFSSYDEIVSRHIKVGDWEQVKKIKLDNMLFNDGAYTYIMRKTSK